MSLQLRYIHLLCICTGISYLAGEAPGQHWIFMMTLEKKSFQSWLLPELLMCTRFTLNNLQSPNERIFHSTPIQTLSTVLTRGVVAAVSRVITAAFCGVWRPYISINKWLKQCPKYLCHFSAPRLVRSISRGRCGSATCFTSLLLLWRGQPRQSGAEQQATGSYSCLRSSSFRKETQQQKNKQRGATGRHSRRRRGGCDGVKAAQTAAARAAAAVTAGVSPRAVTKQTLLLSRPPRVSNMVPSGAARKLLYPTHKQVRITCCAC